jgi:hypothetical protein
MTPDERGQRYKEIKERLRSNYDLTMEVKGVGGLAWGFANARGDAQFLFDENKAMQDVLDVMYPFVRRWIEVGESGDCGNWMKDDPAFTALVKAIAEYQGTTESNGNHSR